MNTNLPVQLQNVRVMIFSIFLTFGMLAGAQQNPSDVTFTLNLNTSIDSGMNYTDYVVGDTAAQSRFVIGFEITINDVDGTPLNIGPIAAFCSELQEPISTSTYTFKAAPLRGLAAGHGGSSGTASAGIPNNGIGVHRAARLAYLFDQHYISESLTEWNQIELHAFQLAVWEVTHDTDLSLSNTNGWNFVPTQAGGSDPAFRNDAIALAQSYLDEISTANIAPSYRSNQFEFWALTSITGNSGSDGPGFQDVILATNKFAQITEELSELIVIPEPAMLGLTALTLSMAWFANRRRV
ncbi:MAG: hypothetical protein JJU29_08325 [Verrucomicrobia bacterium]|nr:hypothetical protein [Verrucomicrobiota bacterium]MCH8512117.1 hypothetical protein [Kiritimatiellia bacterium]